MRTSNFYITIRETVYKDGILESTHCDSYAFENMQDDLSDESLYQTTSQYCQKAVNDKGAKIDITLYKEDDDV